MQPSVSKSRTGQNILYTLHGSLLPELAPCEIVICKETVTALLDVLCDWPAVQALAIRKHTIFAATDTRTERLSTGGPATQLKPWTHASEEDTDTFTAVVHRPTVLGVCWESEIKPSLPLHNVDETHMYAQVLRMIPRPLLAISPGRALEEAGRYLGRQPGPQDSPEYPYPRIRLIKAFSHRLFGHAEAPSVLVAGRS